MVKIINAPDSLIPGVEDFKAKIFLAGSIEMGVAERWQDKAIKLIEERNKYYNFLVLNPRRVNWDMGWEQSIDNPQFFKQVNWELHALEIATDILMYFDPNTKSPISLFEMGLAINRSLNTSYNKLKVVCPKGFYRKGNVDIVCERYQIAQFDTIESAITTITGTYGYSGSGTTGTSGTNGISGTSGTPKPTSAKSGTKRNAST